MKRKEENRAVLTGPTHEGWIVCWQETDGKTHATNFIYKSKYHAQRKADELMLAEQKHYFITECIY